jgi:DNA-binding CsgD family transcriptional regulator
MLCTNLVVTQTGEGDNQMAPQHDALFSTAIDLIGKAYEAAAKSDWPRFLNAVADATSGDGTILWLHNADDGSARIEDSGTSFLCNVRMDPDCLRSYAEHYTHTNVLLEKIDAVPEGSILASTEVISDTDFHKTEFYNDWLRPQGIGYMLGGPVLKRRGVVSMFSISRPQRLGPYVRRDMELLSLVMPHLRRACLLHMRLAGLNNPQSSSLAALELLPMPVWLFDDCGQVLFTNRAARELNSSRDGVWLDGHGRPVAADPGESHRLRRAIDAAIAAGKGRAAAFEGAFAIRRSHSPLPLQVMVYPLVYDGLVDRGAAAMFGTGAVRGDIESEAPRWIYGLTKTEARLATHLARGKSLAEYCMTNAVTANTARTHLKRVFDKTGTRRQAQLASLLSGCISPSAGESPGGLC